MRFRLLRRRLTVSAPRMSVRSALPWPFRWAMIALVFGFCAAIGLWAFEFGKEIAGVDGNAHDELQKAKLELTALRGELATAIAAREKAQSIADTSGTLVTTEKAAQEGLVAQHKVLDTENRRLKEELGFFEKLIPPTGAEGITVRGLQAEVLAGRQLKWQVLLMNAQKNAPDFTGKLEVNFAGTQNGKPWTAAAPGGATALKFRQFGRTEGIFDLPEQTTVKSVSVKVVEGSVVRASQTLKI
jgi:hypothetical protein